MILNLFISRPPRIHSCRMARERRGGCSYLRWPARGVLLLHLLIFVSLFLPKVCSTLCIICATNNGGAVPAYGFCGLHVTNNSLMFLYLYLPSITTDFIPSTFISRPRLSEPLEEHWFCCSPGHSHGKPWMESSEWTGTMGPCEQAPFTCISL